MNIKTIKYCHKFLSLRFKKDYLILLFLNFVSSIFNIVGATSILPLVSLIVSPEVILKNEYYNKIEIFKQFTLNEQIFFFSFISFFLITLTTFFKFFIGLLEIRLTNKIHNYLHESSTNEFLNTNLLSKIKIGLIEYRNEIVLGMEKFTSTNAIFINTLNNTVSLIFYLLFLTFINYLIPIIILFVCIIFYLLYNFARNPLFKNSQLLRIYSKMQHKIDFHVAHGFREILLMNIQNKIISSLKNVNLKNLQLITKNYLYGNLARHMIEIILVLIILVIINFNLSIGINKTESLSFLAVIFYTLFKSLPLISGIYKGLSEYKSIQSVVDRVVNKQNIFFKKTINQKNTKKNTQFFSKSLYKIKNNIHLKNVKFSYDSQNYLTYNEKIKKKDWVLVKGKSGSGKTTLFNLICGLINPVSGKILFDEKDILNSKLTPSIGYIHQSPLIFDGTIAYNICFKEQISNLDRKKMKQIYDICGLKNFIKKFDDIFSKKVGFDALTLSGGQKQRLAIARNLFRDPSILIMDESFNALDMNSERKILKKIRKNYREITIFLASHRISSKDFNKVINI